MEPSDPTSKSKAPVPTDAVTAAKRQGDNQEVCANAVEELDAFVNGLFGDEEALELPESAHVAVKNLGDVRSFFLGFVQFADDHDMSEAVRETVGKIQQLSIICGKEINTVMLSCVRARRATLDTMRGAVPGWH